MKVTNKALATVFLSAGAGVDAASTMKSAVAGLALLSAGVQAQTCREPCDCSGKYPVICRCRCEGYTCSRFNGLCVSDSDFGSGPGPSPPRDKSAPIGRSRSLDPTQDIVIVRGSQIVA